MSQEYNNLYYIADYFFKRKKYDEALEPMLQLVQELIYSADFDSAYELNEKAIICASETGKKNKKALALNSKGIILFYMGDLEKSINTFGKSLEISKEVNDRRVEAYTLYQIGLCCEQLKDYTLAMDYYNTSLKINHEIGDLAGEANALHKKAIIHLNMGRYGEAEDLFYETRKIWQQVLGEDHPEYAEVLINLANLYIFMGHYGEAEKLYLEAKEIIIKVLGEDHPEYAEVLINLANLYNIFMDNYGEAEKLYLEAKEIIIKVLGEDHPKYAEILNNLANIYQNMPKYDDYLVNKSNQDRKKEQIFTNTLGIDLGTLNTVVAKPSGDKFELFKTPSMVAVKKEEPSYVLAVGEEAKSELGSTFDDIVVVRPLRNGVIESIAQVKALLLYAMEQAFVDSMQNIDIMVIAIPGDASEIEKKAIEEIGLVAGANFVLVISEGLAAAIGAGLANATGTIVIDLGAGSSDIVVISLGGIIDIETIRQGGDNIDENIVAKVKKLFKVEIGIHEAEKAKIEVGMVHSQAKIKPLVTHVIGKLKTNKPQEVDIDSNLVADAAEPIVTDLIDALSHVLIRMSPELISEVYNKTIVVGGTSQLKGLKERIFEEVGVPVEISDDPMTLVAKGAAMVAAVMYETQLSSFLNIKNLLRNIKK